MYIYVALATSIYIYIYIYGYVTTQYIQKSPFLKCYTKKFISKMLCSWTPKKLSAYLLKLSCEAWGGKGENIYVFITFS